MIMSLSGYHSTKYTCTCVNNKRPTIRLNSIYISHNLPADAAVEREVQQQPKQHRLRPLDNQSLSPLHSSSVQNLAAILVGDASEEAMGPLALNNRWLKSALDI